MIKLKFLLLDLILFLDVLFALSIDHPLSKIFENDPDFNKFKDECTKMGTTEEALAQAEKLGFNTNLFAKNHLMKILKFGFC